jgi:hypothetical protein
MTYANSCQHQLHSLQRYIKLQRNTVRSTAQLACVTPCVGEVWLSIFSLLNAASGCYCTILAVVRAAYGEQ